MIAVGIDPGLSGGVAVLKDGEPLQIFPMPLDDDGQLHKEDLATFFMQNHNYITKCFIEMPSARFGEAPQSSLKAGRNFGVIEGFMILAKIPFEIVLAKSWSEKYPHGVTEKDAKKKRPLIKKARAEIVKKMYPDLDLRPTQKCINWHDGMVDSVLIGHYGWSKSQPKGEV